MHFHCNKLEFEIQIVFLLGMGLQLGSTLFSITAKHHVFLYFQFSFHQAPNSILQRVIFYCTHRTIHRSINQPQNRSCLPDGITILSFHIYSFKILQQITQSKSKYFCVRSYIWQKNFEIQAKKRALSPLMLLLRLFKARKLMLFPSQYKEKISYFEKFRQLFQMHYVDIHTVYVLNKVKQQIGASEVWSKIQPLRKQVPNSPVIVFEHVGSQKGTYTNSSNHTDQY